MRSRIDRSQRRIGDDAPRTLQVSFADLTFGWVKGTRDGYYDRTGALAVAVLNRATQTPSACGRGPKGNNRPIVLKNPAAGRLGG